MRFVAVTPPRRWEVYFHGPRTVDQLAFMMWREDGSYSYLHFTDSPVSMRPGPALTHAIQRLVREPDEPHT